MRVFHLAIYHLYAAAFCDINQRDQRDLGGISSVTEHGLAEKHASECHAVEPADQRAPVIEHFHRVSKSKRMQLRVGRHHILVNPGADAVSPGLAT